MKTFIVYYPLNGALNIFLKRETYEYEEICRIEANELHEVFYRAQNDLSEKYAKLGRRSTSVGDIVVDQNNQRHYFISPVGYQLIPKTVLDYIDWRNHVSDIDETDKI